MTGSPWGGGCTVGEKGPRWPASDRDLRRQGQSGLLKAGDAGESAPCSPEPGSPCVRVRQGLGLSLRRPGCRMYLDVFRFKTTTTEATRHPEQGRLAERRAPGPVSARKPEGLTQGAHVKAPHP